MPQRLGFARLGHLVHARRRLVIGLALAFAALAATFGPAVQDEVSVGGFDDPASESSRAAAALEAAFGPTAGDVVVLWRHPTARLAHPRPRARS